MALYRLYAGAARRAFMAAARVMALRALAYLSAAHAHDAAA